MKKTKLKIVFIVLSIPILSVWSSCKKEDINHAALEITKPPVDLTVEKGDTDDANCLYVEAEGDEKELFYQWSIPWAENGEGQIIEGATEATYIPAKNEVGVRRYFVSVWSANSNHVSSNFVTVTVVEQESEKEQTK